MRIITEEKLREFIFEDGAKLFYTPLSMLDYNRVVFTPENIRAMNKKKVYPSNISKKELERLQKEDENNLQASMILNHAEQLFCDTCIVENWEGFEDEHGNKLEFSQDLFRKFIKSCDIAILARMTNEFMGGFEATKKKETKKKTKKNSRT